MALHERLRSTMSSDDEATPYDSLLASLPVSDATKMLLEARQAQEEGLEDEFEAAHAAAAEQSDSDLDDGSADAQDEAIGSDYEKHNDEEEDDAESVAVQSDDGSGTDSDLDDLPPHDTFNTRFANTEEEEDALQSSLATLRIKHSQTHQALPWNVTADQAPVTIEKIGAVQVGDISSLPAKASINSLGIKDRIISTWRDEVLAGNTGLDIGGKRSRKSLKTETDAELAKLPAKRLFSELQLQMWPVLAQYADLYMPVINPGIERQVRSAVVLHAVNHALKAADLMRKHKHRIRMNAAKRREQRTEARVKAAADAAAEDAGSDEDAGLKRKRGSRVKTAQGGAKRKQKKKALLLDDDEDDEGSDAVAEREAAGADEDGVVTYQDQGFTRARVLFLCPFRHNALSIVKKIMRLNPWREIMKKRRFLVEFGDPELPIEEMNTMDTDASDFEDDDAAAAEPDQPESDGEAAADGSKKAKKEKLPNPKPRDYRRTFRGNIDDDFKIGIRFTRKTVNLYTRFYDADIIVASPVGLRRIIGGEADKGREFDFLSSIEVCIVDQADAILMQNWQHVTDIMNVLNKVPKDMHETDFSRVRDRNLAGLAQYFRQTILLSSIPDPLFARFFRKQCHNTAGMLQIMPQYPGILGRIVPTIRQVWHRIKATSAATQSDQRFKLFKKKFVPQLKSIAAGSSAAGPTLVFVPSYLDYVRMRNELQRQEVDHVTCCEYTEAPSISRARSWFFHGQVKVLLCTERFHYYRRYQLRGIRNYIFYAPPTNAQFYPELLNLLEDSSNQHGASSIALFSKYDSGAVERIVGTERAGKLLDPDEKSTFVFC